LVPIAPGLEDTPELREEYRDLVLDDIAENTDTELRDRIVFEETFCVDDFADRYNSYQEARSGWHTPCDRLRCFARPPVRRARRRALLHGVDDDPGIGVPMCLISGQLTAEELSKTA